MDLKHQIEHYAEGLLNEIGGFIVDVKIVHESGKSIIQLFIDTDTGITIDQCAEISRQLGKTLELDNVVPSSYVLQISSPGVKKPIKLLRQYKKNIGRRFKIRYLKNGSIANTVAKLTSLEGDMLIFESEKDNNFAIPFNEIIESIEELDW